MEHQRNNPNLKKLDEDDTPVFENHLDEDMELSEKSENNLIFQNNLDDENTDQVDSIEPSIQHIKGNDDNEEIRELVLTGHPSEQNRREQFDDSRAKQRKIENAGTSNQADSVGGDLPTTAINKCGMVLVNYMNGTSLIEKFLADTELFEDGEIRDIMKIQKPITKNRFFLKKIQKKGPLAYSKLKTFLEETYQQDIAEMLTMAESEQDISEIQNSIKMKGELKDDLIAFYKQKESCISVSPLVDEHDIPVVGFYVLPPMLALERPNLFGQHKATAKKNQVTSYSDLFICKENNNLYKSIYVTGDAGIGKTSFAKHLAVTWCQAHQPDEDIISELDHNDIKTMRRFDFLILIHLRNYHGHQEFCYLDDIIVDMIMKCLSRSNIFSKDFLHKVLYENCCLVILDGLDEWTHPERSSFCRDNEKIPHRKVRPNCTVLTTTRPWKLSDVKLSTKQIDRHIEISILDNKSARKLEANAFKLLNKNTGSLHEATNKEMKRSFRENISAANLGNLRFSPYVLLQLICLCIENRPLGNTKGEIYRNIIRFTIQRGCLKNNISSIQIKTCILKLGELAFHTLIHGHEVDLPETYIENEMVLRYLYRPELEFLFKVGILSKTKDTRSLSCNRYHVFFQHKSIKDYFAAYYVSNRGKSIYATIKEACSTLPNILKFSDVFIFISGMNATVFSDIVKGIENVIQEECKLKKAGCDEDELLSFTNDMFSYQMMQVACIEENPSVRDCFLSINVILITDRMTDGFPLSMKRLAQCNKDKVKSFDIRHNPTDIQSFLKGVDLKEYRYLESVCVVTQSVPEFLSDIFTGSFRALKCLRLDLTVKIELPDGSVSELTKLENLQSLRFVNVRLSHKMMGRFFTFIENARSISYIVLKSICCTDHGHCGECFPLDLSRLDHLHLLYLTQLPVRQLCVNATSLVDCLIGAQVQETTALSLLASIKGSSKLQSLDVSDISEKVLNKMLDIIKSLSQIRTLRMSLTNLRDGELTFDTNSCIDYVCLRRVTLKISTLIKLIETVSGLQQPVTVELQYCKGPSEQEWTEFSNMLDDRRIFSAINILQWSKQSDTDSQVSFKIIKNTG